MIKTVDRRRNVSFFFRVQKMMKRREWFRDWALTLMEAWPVPQPASQARWWPAVRAASLENQASGYRGRFLVYVSDGLSYSPAILALCFFSITSTGPQLQSWTVKSANCWGGSGWNL
ncbi:hypothetical protein EE612_005346 [Oryza sativa]|nr:hypothetical protein EE612_005346 [Oryza sativa]